MIHELILALSGRFSGRYCRSCTQPIDRKDLFGQSEGVCQACVA